MMKNVKKHLVLIQILLYPLVLLFPAHSAFAAAVNVALSASPSSVQNGSNVVVAATINTTGTVIDAQVKITYDATKLTYVSADYTSSPITDDLGSAAASGSYTMDRYKAGGPFPSGSIFLGRLTFKAIAGSGTTSVAISNADSTVGDGSSNTGASHSPFSSTPVTITLTSPPPPTCPAGQTGTPPNCVTTTTTTTTTPTTTTSNTVAAPSHSSNNAQQQPVTVNPTTKAVTPVAASPVTPKASTPVVKAEAKKSNAGMIKIGLSVGGVLAVIAAGLFIVRYLFAQKRKSVLYSGVPYTTMGTPATPASTMPHETQKVFDSLPTNVPSPATVVNPGGSVVTPQAPPSNTVIQPSATPTDPKVIQPTPPPADK